MMLFYRFFVKKCFFLLFLERSSFCRKGMRSEIPESVRSERFCCNLRRHRFQGCSSLCQGKVRNDKSCLRRLQWLSALFQGKSALKQQIQSWLFLLWNFGVSALFRRKSALFQRKSALKQLWFSADFLLWKFPASELFQRKSALFSSESALFQRKSALFQRWFLALKISVFSAVQSWISAVQRFSGNEQHWNRPEGILN